jgi:predicted nucleic acid-binding protein
MRWCFESTSNVYAETILQQLASGASAVVPVLWRYEVGAVLAKAERGGIISSQKAREFLTALGSLQIMVDPDGPDRVFSDVYRLAMAYRLTGYDVVYLELALRRNLSLATLDADLARACRAAGGKML